jgi:glucose/arabinose dehydrogenase
VVAKVVFVPPPALQNHQGFADGADGFVSPAEGDGGRPVGVVIDNRGALMVSMTWANQWCGASWCGDALRRSGRANGRG